MKNVKKIVEAIKEADEKTQKEAFDKVKEIKSVKDHLRENIAYDGSNTSEAESFNADINYLRNQLAEMLGIDLEDEHLAGWL